MRQLADLASNQGGSEPVSTRHYTALHWSQCLHFIHFITLPYCDCPWDELVTHQTSEQFWQLKDHDVDQRHAIENTRDLPFSARSCTEDTLECLPFT